MLVSDDARDKHPSGLRYSFRALRHRNFLVFWLSAVVSNSGAWLSNLTIPFVLYQLTGNALWVGYAAIAQYVPLVLIGPWGGALADRIARKQVLLITQSAMAVFAFGLFASWQLEFREPLVILGFVAGTAFVNGLNLPSWQAFINDLVPREDLRSAVALNAVQLNATRAIGPAIGGILLATAGPGVAFLINALSFAAVIVALLLVQPITRQTKVAIGVPSSSAWAIIDAIRYTFRHPGLRMTVILAMLFSLLGNPIYTLTVILADDVYGVDPLGLGLLNAALGVGAIAVAPLVAGGGDQGLRLSRLVRIALMACGCALLVIGIADNYVVGLTMLGVVGAAGLGVVATSQSALQFIVADDMRGRVISVRFLLMFGMMPLGTQLQTVVAEAFGIQAAIIAAASSMLVITAALLALPPRLGLNRLDDSQDERR